MKGGDKMYITPQEILETVLDKMTNEQLEHWEIPLDGSLEDVDDVNITLTNCKDAFFTHIDLSCNFDNDTDKWYKVELELDQNQWSIVYWEED